MEEVTKVNYLLDEHKLSRLIWCKHHKNTDFSKFIFVDETTVRLNDKPLYHWRQKSSLPRSFGCSNKFNRKKINVWVGISFNGVTDFAVSIKIDSSTSI